MTSTDVDMDACTSCSDIKCQLGHLHRADGSCALAVRDTFVWASVYGPADLAMSKQKTDECVVDVNLRPAIAIPGRIPAGFSQIERMIVACVESSVMVNLLPRALVQVSVQQLQDDGCLFEAAVNSTCLALLDASIPMRQVFVAVHLVAYTKPDSTQSCIAVKRHIDKNQLNNFQEITISATFWLVFTCKRATRKSNSSSEMQLVSTTSSGKFSSSEFERAVYIGNNEAIQWMNTYRHVVRDYFGDKQT